MKKKKEKTTRSLLGAWVCELANNLCNESEIPMTKSEAFRKAHMARELLEHLGEGVVTFEYLKKDGSRRTARGTLCNGVDVAFDNHVYANEKLDQNYTPGSTNFTYWDVEKHGFRTFGALGLIKIIDVRIISCKQPLTEFV